MKRTTIRVGLVVVFCLALTIRRSHIEAAAPAIAGTQTTLRILFMESLEGAKPA